MKKILLVVVCFFVFANQTYSDVLYTKDGSKLVGTIEEQYEGKIIINTAIAGKLEVDASMITGISTDNPVNVSFSSGDKLVGSLTHSPEETKTTVDSNFGPIEVDSSKIQSIWQKDKEDPKEVALQNEVQKAKEAAKPKWTTIVEAGGTITKGNKDTMYGNAKAFTHRKTDSDFLKFFIEGHHGEEEDQRTTSEILGGVLYENTFWQRMFWFAKVTMEYDEFENLDLRSTAVAGLGYQWLKETNQELKTRLGAGYRHESFDTGEDTDDFVVDLSWDYWLDIAPVTKFTHEGSFSPSVDDFGDYRLYADTGFLFPLASDRWAFKVGMKNEYNSEPNPGIDELDNTYYANIVLKLQ